MIIKMRHKTTTSSSGDILQLPYGFTFAEKIPLHTRHEDGSIYFINYLRNLRGTAGSEFPGTPAGKPLHFEIVIPGTVSGKKTGVAGEATHLLNYRNTFILRDGGGGTEVIHDNIASRKHFPNNLTSISKDTQVGFVINDA